MGTISPEDEFAFEKWLQRDTHNRERYEQLLNKKDLVTRYKSTSNINIHKAYKLFKKKVFPHHSFFNSYITRAAFILFLVIGITVGLQDQFNHKPTPPVLSKKVEKAIQQSIHFGKLKADLLVPGGKTITLTSDEEAKKIEEQFSLNDYQKFMDSCHIHTHPNSEFWLTLSDDTKVHLNNNTTLVYPITFKGSCRTVFLSGEAYFYVTKNTSKPFYVKTANGAIRQYGTEFNVSTVNPQGSTQVVLVKGKISVLTSHKEQILKPNDMAIIDPSQSVSIKKVDTDPYIAWNTGSFVFNDASLEKIMNVLSHWYNVKVEYSNNDIRKVHFIGSFSRYGSIQPALKAISLSTGLSLNLENGIVRIKH